MSDTHPDRTDDSRADDGPTRAPRPERPSDAFTDIVDALQGSPREDQRVATTTPMGLTEATTALAGISLAEASLTEVMRQVASLAQATVPGADEVSITLVDGARTSTVAFTGDLAVQLDERQYEDGFGPCMDAARTGGSIPMFDLGREERYPEFVSAARRAGVTGTLSVGMPVPSRVVGGLNIYARPTDTADHALGQESMEVAEAFAGYAAIAVSNAGLLHTTRRFAEQMVEAMTSRGVIEQAKGILVGRTRCSPEEAFARLVHISRTEGRKVAKVAADLVAEAQRSQPS